MTFGRKILEAVLFGMAVVAWSSTQSYRALSPDVVDLGSLLEGQIAEGEVRFVNAGNQPLRIASVRTSCGCTAVRPEKTELASNDTATVHFTLNTTGFHGLIRKTITIAFEGDPIKDLVFFIQARIHAAVEIQPSFLVFQSVPLHGERAVFDSLRVVNDSERPVRVLKMRPDTELIQVLFEPITIPPHRDAAFRVILKPRRVEYRNAVLAVETDHPLKPNLLIPVLIDVVE